jgi:hypothetical protein
LACFQKRQENDLPIWEFERIVMGVWDFSINLTEDRSPVLYHVPTPGGHTLTPDFLRKRQLSARKETNCHPFIFRRTEASRSPIESVGG